MKVQELEQYKDQYRKSQEEVKTLKAKVVYIYIYMTVFYLIIGLLSWK